MIHLGGRLQEVQIFVGEFCESKIGKILFAADWRQFRPAFDKIHRVIIFEPYEEWSWNFQESIFFMKVSYGLSGNKIWGVTHGTIWWFDMEWPK